MLSGQQQTVCRGLDEDVRQDLLRLTRVDRADDGRERAGQVVTKNRKFHGRSQAAVASGCGAPARSFLRWAAEPNCVRARRRSEEHTSELQSLMRISYAVFCLKKKN